MPYNSLVSRTDAAALVPEEVSQAMLTSLSAQSAVLELGNTIPISRNQTRFPVLSALPTAYFVTGDTGLKQTTEAAWDNKYMYVEEIATIVPIPESVLDDAGFDVWQALQPLMEGAIARTLDAAVIFGTSAPTTWATEGNLVGKAVAAGNVIARGTNAAAAGGVVGDLSDTVATLEADGFVPNGAVGNITFKARLRNARTTTGEQQSLLADIPDIRFLPSLAGLWPSGVNAAEVLIGDFSKLVVGVRQDMTYKLITEGVITDNTGAIIYNLPQQDMVALRLVFRAAYAVANPINYQQGTEGSRSPFAVLRSPAELIGMANDLRSSAPGEFGALRLVAGTIGFAQSSVTLDTLATGDVVVNCWAQVLTAFNAATTNVLIAGNGVTTNKFLAAADVTEGTPGVYPTGGAGPFTAETADGSLVVAYSQTGTAATTGSARVYALISSAAV